MLDSNIQNQLRDHFDKLKQPIELVASLNASPQAQQMRELLHEIAALSPKISLREDGTDARLPSFSVGRAGEGARVRFAGVPMGHEFTSLVLALLQAGGHPPKVSEETLEQIRAIEGQYHFETYVSLSCHNCPDVVQAFNLMALYNPNITHTMIDGALFQGEVNQHQIMGVPTVYLNGEFFDQGRMELAQILARIDTSHVAREVEKLNAKPTFDVLIVGGGPAAAAAAIYAARKGLHTSIVAERFGGQVLDTLTIENFISVIETDGPKLVAALEMHVKSYDVDIMNLQRAEQLVKSSDHFEVKLANGAVLKSKTVILATGARWRELNVPGEKEYRGHGVAYCPHCDGPLFKGKKVAVVGGGNSGVEAAIDLAGFVAHVTLLEFAERLRADAVLLNRLNRLPNVTVICQAQTTQITGEGGKVNGLTYLNRAAGTLHHIDVAGVFVQIGLVPNTNWLKGTVELSPYGEIVVDSYNMTSLPGVFAAGDVTTTPYKQIVIAVGDGARAALGAFDYLIRH